MKPIEVRPLTDEETTALDDLYHQTKVVRVRTRAQMILLAAEEKMTAPQIARIVRQDEQTVRRWLKRFNREGINGLYDEPKSGSPRRVTDAYRERLLVIVRQRPRSLEQPYSLWTLQRLVDFMAEETGLRFSSETVRLILKANDIVISRPQHKVSSPDPEYEVKKRRLKSSETT
jgi:transposase